MLDKVALEGSIRVEHLLLYPQKGRSRIANAGRVIEGLQQEPGQGI
jgi:hypothetical protein